jgi:hypothetical protein
MKGLVQNIEFDVEFGNSIGFFSGKKSGHYSNATFKENKKLTLNGSLDKTSVSVLDTYQDTELNEILRKTQFTALNNSQLFDLVSRFVVQSENDTARINNKNIFHNSSNIYHQMNVDEDSVIKIPIDNGWIVFKPTKTHQQDGFKQVFYLRDESNKNGQYRWIVHHRLIADASHAKMILRCCHPVMEGVVPFEKLIPRFMKIPLFRIRESTYPNFPFMVVGESTLFQGQSIELKTRIYFEKA